MTSDELRKTRMRLLASLYEVASRFTERELSDLRNAPADDDGWVKSIVESLLRLQESVVSVPQKRTLEPAAPSASRRESALSSRRREAALRQLLLSKDLFATPKDLFTTVPGAAPLRPKESREKYVNRILAEFRGLSPGEQANFTDAVQHRLATSSKSNFVSKWTRLIRDL